MMPNAVYRREMEAFEDYLRSRFPRKNKFSDEVAKAIFASGGKRLRPAFTIMFALTGGNYNRERAFATAAAIEMLHTATLVHDDIIDSADVRRGVPTVNAEYGTHMAVYTGDYLLLKAMHELIQLDEYDSVKVRRVVRTLTEICVGEIDQYFSRQDIGTLLGYFRRIRRKTAVLFAAACALGAYDAGYTEKGINRAFRFGLDFGMAFQIRDDIKNFIANPADDGKPVLNDLKDGIVTLPVLLAAGRSPGFRQKLKTYFRRPGELKSLFGEVIRHGGIEKSEKVMRRYAQRAQEGLAYFRNDMLAEGMGKIMTVLYA
ncbi:MAG: polyprenyl synthetase family protein [bacterium]